MKSAVKRILTDSEAAVFQSCVDHNNSMLPLIRKLLTAKVNELDTTMGIGDFEVRGWELKRAYRDGGIAFGKNLLQMLGDK